MARKKKLGRNAPCPCGSGKKYKKCCKRLVDNPRQAEQEFQRAELERWDKYKEQNPDAEPGRAINAYQKGMSLKELERKPNSTATFEALAAALCLWMPPPRIS